jgi:hypothetical protein
MNTEYIASIRDQTRVKHVASRNINLQLKKVTSKRYYLIEIAVAFYNLDFLHSNY